MKKAIVFIVFFLIAASAHAQTPAQTSATAQENSITSLGMRVYSGGMLLNKSEVKSLLFGTPGYDLYNRALSKKTTGFVLLGLGAGTAGFGVFVFMVTGLIHVMGEGEGPRDSYWRNGGGASLGLVLAGGGMIAGGVVLLRTCKNDVTRAVDAYNSSLGRPTGGELTLGFTPGGVGLAFRF